MDWYFQTSDSPWDRLVVDCVGEEIRVHNRGHHTSVPHWSHDERRRRPDIRPAPLAEGRRERGESGREKARRLLALGGLAVSYSSSRDTLTKIIRKTATIPIPVMVSSVLPGFRRSVRA